MGSDTTSEIIEEIGKSSSRERLEELEGDLNNLMEFGKCLICNQN